MSVLWSADDFNRFRETYPQLTFQDKKRIYTELRELYPRQSEFLHDMEFLIAALPKEPDKTIVEYGGYGGLMAALFLRENPSWRWVNIELIPHKPHWLLRGKNYVEIVLEKELWQSNFNLKADVFLTEQTIEHLSNGEFGQFVQWLKKQQYPTVMLGSPLATEGQTWQDYYGAHVLTFGTRQVTDLMGPEYKIVQQSKSRGWIAKFDNSA